MDIFTDEQKKDLAGRLAAVAGILFASGIETETAELVDDAVAYSAYKVSNSQWTPEMGRYHVSVAVNAAASYHASTRHIALDASRQVVVDFLKILAQSINSKLGVDLLPS